VPGARLDTSRAKRAKFGSTRVESTGDTWCSFPVWSAWCSQSLCIVWLGCTKKRACFVESTGDTWCSFPVWSAWCSQSLCIVWLGCTKKRACLGASEMKGIERAIIPHYLKLNSGDSNLSNPLYYPYFQTSPKPKGWVRVAGVVLVVLPALLMFARRAHTVGRVDAS
jgi:hypothetical protein